MFAAQEVTVAIIAAIGAVLVAVIPTLLVQRKVHKDNRSDHAETARKVDGLVAGFGEIREDVRDVKDDVRDVKADVRSQGVRLKAVERAVDGGSNGQAA